jgi:hypothetical protein
VAGCQLLSTCIFFNDRMPNMPGMVELYKSSYCKGDNSFCARYRVFSAIGREGVPADMFPNDRDRADRIIKG